MSGRRHEPRKRYYNRTRFRFDDWKSTSSEDGEPSPKRNDVTRPLPLSEGVDGEVEATRQPEHELQQVQRGQEPVPAELPKLAPDKPRAEAFSMPPLMPPPAEMDSDEYCGHCDGGVRAICYIYMSIYQVHITFPSLNQPVRQTSRRRRPRLKMTKKRKLPPSKDCYRSHHPMPPHT